MKYQVLSPLLHDGKRYEAGEIVEMSTEEAYIAGGVQLLTQPQTPQAPQTEEGEKKSSNDPLTNLPKGKK